MAPDQTSPQVATLPDSGPSLAPAVLGALAPLTRREFIFRLTAIFAASSSWVVSACSRGTSVPVPSTGPFDEATLARLRAFAETVLPPGDEPALVEVRRVAAGRVSSALAELGKRTTAIVRGAIWVVEYLPMVTERTGARFSRLSLADRAAVLEAWIVSRITLKRLIVTSLKKAVFFSAYGNAELRSYVGFAGPWISDSAPPAAVVPLGMGISIEGIAYSDSIATWEDLRK